MFETTPPICPHLVTIIIGEFEKLETDVSLNYDMSGNSGNNSTRLIIYTPVGRAAEGRTVPISVDVSFTP